MKSKLLSAAIIAVSCFAIYGGYKIFCTPNPIVLPSNLSDKEMFSYIYQTKYWGSWSGPELQKDKNGKHPFIDYLQKFINENNITTIVDMGCGYGKFLKDLKLPPYTSYLGLDIVDSVIAYNKVHYERENFIYDTVDSVEDLSKHKGDLLVIKDVIQHWSNKQIMYFKENILPNFKYAIIVNNVSMTNPAVNTDIIPGNSRPLNLEIAPFYMNLKVIKDYNAVPPRVKRIYLYENNKISHDTPPVETPEFK